MSKYNYTPEEKEFLRQEQKDFYTKAVNISDDPQTRVSAVTREVIQRGNFVFDAHCHVFDGNCVNVRYVIARMLDAIPLGMIALMIRLITGKATKQIIFTDKKKVVEVIYEDDSILEEDEDIKGFLDRVEKNIQEEEAKHADGEDGGGEKKQLHWIRGVINILRKDFMKDVYENFRDNYAIQTVVEGNKELITIVLGMDLNKGWEEKNIGKWGRIKKSNNVQVKELGELADKYPVLPFLPLDPRRALEKGPGNLYQMFYDNFKPGGSNYFGVKIYPSLGYAPSDSRLTPIFDICAEKKIPVVTHCGGESVSTFARPVIVERDGIHSKVKGLGRATRARTLNEPGEWTEVLKRYMEPGKELYVNFGHFGSARAWSDPLGPKAQRVKVIIDMMRNHKAFADFSFNLSNSKATDSFAEKLHDKSDDSRWIAQRCMYGTDFWVVLPRTNLAAAQADFIRKIGTHADAFLVKNVMSFLRLKE